MELSTVSLLIFVDFYLHFLSPLFFPLSFFLFGKIIFFFDSFTPVYASRYILSFTFENHSKAYPSAQTVVRFLRHSHQYCSRGSP